jgi:uncharacterized coiled-coil protein SlyX
MVYSSASDVHARSYLVTGVQIMRTTASEVAALEPRLAALESGLAELSDAVVHAVNSLGRTIDRLAAKQQCFADAKALRELQAAVAKLTEELATLRDGRRRFARKRTTGSDQ